MVPSGSERHGALDHRAAQDAAVPRYLVVAHGAVEPVRLPQG
jgi:hypothetical protein